jgi:hypothetical protein
MKIMDIRVDIINVERQRRPANQVGLGALWCRESTANEVATALDLDLLFFFFRPCHIDGAEGG